MEELIIKIKKWKGPQWNFPDKVYLGLGILLLIAAAPILLYGLYIVIKILVCGLCAVLSYQNFNATGKKSIWGWFFLVMAILFNPIIAIYMPKAVWVAIDIMLGLLFIFLAYQTRYIRIKGN